MPEVGFNGYQPGVASSTRRAFFDVRRLLTELTNRVTAIEGADVPANGAGGIVAFGTMTGGTVDIAAGASATLASGLTYTPAVGRRYRLVFQTRATQPLTAPPVSGVMTILDGVSVFGVGDYYFATSVNFDGFRAEFVFSGGGVAVDLSARMTMNTGNARFFVEVAGNSRFYLEDVGPT